MFLKWCMAFQGGRLKIMHYQNMEIHILALATLTPTATLPQFEVY